MAKLIKKEFFIEPQHWDRLTKHAAMLTRRTGGKHTQSALIRVAVAQFLNTIDRPPTPIKGLVNVNNKSGNTKTPRNV